MNRKSKIKRYYVTIFDKNYLYQAVALYKSLMSHSCRGYFELFTLCLDDISAITIENLKLQNVKILNINDLSNERFKKIWGNMTYPQYCWSLQPIVCSYILEKFQVDRITYLEADSLFYSDPEILFDEISNADASLVPHNFYHKYDNETVAGKYCVQFNSFSNTINGKRILNYWTESCLKSNVTCPSIYHGQLCLDKWESEFNNVRAIKNLGAGVAPWNIQKYQYSYINEKPFINNIPIVFYHFHEYAHFKNGNIFVGNYEISPKIIGTLYKNYEASILNAKDLIKSFGLKFNYQRTVDYQKLMTLIKCFILNPSQDSLSKIYRYFSIKKNIYKKLK